MLVLPGECRSLLKKLGEGITLRFLSCTQICLINLSGKSLERVIRINHLKLHHLKSYKKVRYSIYSCNMNTSFELGYFKNIYRNWKKRHVKSWETLQTHVDRAIF